LDRYTVPEEVELIQRFERGEPPPATSNDEWCGLLSKGKGRGGRFQRVRLLREPYNTYISFEILWGYQFSIAAGEEISSIHYAGHPSFCTSVPILKDIWLFDDKVGFLMEYDFIGRFLGVTRIPVKILDLYLALKREALATSSPIQGTSLWKKVISRS
jgi:hypothetical protein